jgi:hypothetical protein
MTTDSLLEPLRTAILSAQCVPDADLRRLAVHRYFALHRALADLPAPVRAHVDRHAHAMLPGDWPLWVECSRTRQRIRRRPLSA